MTVFLCENSIAGIFSGVYDAWASRAGHDNVRLALAENYNLELFAEYVTVMPDPEKAEKVIGTLKKRMHWEDFLSVYRAVLSADPDKADSIYRVIVLAVHTSRRMIDHLEQPDVYHVFSMARKVGNEAARYLEFVRFRELENKALFSEIHPENQVLPLIGDHFADRFPLEHFLIYDSRHHLALFHAAKHAWVLMDMPEDMDPQRLRFSREEQEMSRYWQAFFDQIAIEERTNPRLQQQFLPLKFRAYMTEKFHKNSEN